MNTYGIWSKDYITNIKFKENPEQPPWELFLNSPKDTAQVPYVMYKPFLYYSSFILR